VGYGTQPLGAQTPVKLLIKINNTVSGIGKRIRAAVAALLGKSPQFQKILFDCCGKVTELVASTPAEDGVINRPRPINASSQRKRPRLREA
jgi:hypothetical protein